MEPLGIHEVDDEIRHLCEDAEHQTGTSASTRTYARNPAVFKALTAFRGRWCAKARSIPSSASWCRIKIAGLNACRY